MARLRLTSRLAIVTLLTAGMAAGCQPRAPFIKVHDIRIERVDLNRLDLEFQFEVFNPNSHAIEMTGLEFKLAAGGQGFAAGRLEGPGKVEGMESAVVRTPVTVEYRRLLSAAGKYVKHEEIPYELAGSATFRAMGVEIRSPLSHKGTITPIQAPSLHIKAVRRAKGELTTVEAVFEVTNPNSFDIQGLRMKGAVVCGGRMLLAMESPAGIVFPGGKTVEMVVPVRLSLEAAAVAIAESIKGEKPRFEGEFQLSPLVSLREMLLGSNTKVEEMKR
ncbi:MAG: LEA type 2 family protein [Phycisphaerae bacterium]